MNLEIKHLTCYLPYGLKILIEFPNSAEIGLLKAVGLHPGTGDEERLSIFVNTSKENGRQIILPKQSSKTGKSIVKPLLLPLSELTDEQLQQIIKHLFKNSRSIKPRLMGIECKKGFITFYDHSTMQRYTAVKPGGDNLPVLNMSNHFSDYDIFFELQVDVFGLIPAGLALNKNNYPNT